MTLRAYLLLASCSCAHARECHLGVNRTALDGKGVVGQERKKLWALLHMF